jgi:hypothetical protein
MTYFTMIDNDAGPDIEADSWEEADLIVGQLINDGELPPQTEVVGEMIE